MDRERYAKVMEIFGEAVRWPAGERAAVVGELAGDDAALRDEVMSLLAHHRDEPEDGDDVVGEVIGGYRVVAAEAGGGYRGERVSGGGAVRLELRRIDGGVPAGDLLREVAAASPGLVAPEAAGTWTSAAGPCRYLVFGVSGSRTIPATPGWPAERVIVALDAVAQGLAALGERGLVHGAVGVAQLVMAEDGRIRLGGLGSVRRAGDSDPAAEAPGLAPEQRSTALGPVGAWTDVYGLARLCVELMRAPDDASLRPGARGRDDAPPPTPQSLGLDVSDAVEAVMTRALATRPIERFQTPDRFWAALRKAVADAPSPPSTRRAVVPASMLAAPAPAVARPKPAPPRTSSRAAVNVAIVAIVVVAGLAIGLLALALL